MAESMLFSLLGGLGLLLYGIHMMGSGLKKWAGDRMKKILSKVISNRVKGVLVGTGVTAIIQSSSATSVMVVGFVSAGLMSLTQAIAVIFGANIGTTITGQLIAFKLTKFALPIIAIGALFYFFVKKKKDLGEAILGFGILFLGLKIMTSSTKFLADYPFVSDAFVAFSHNPFLAVLAGFLMTVIVQSSSATIGILIALATTGMVDLAAAIPIIFGENIGTCTTALISSISSNTHAKRAALSHLLFNISGTILGLIMLPVYLNLAPLTSTDIARQIANTHTFFNIFNVLIFLPMIPLFVRILERLLPIKAGEEKGPIYLEKKLLNTPSVAIRSATKEIVRMLDITKNMFGKVMDDFFNQSDDNKEKILEMEDTVDELQEEISIYLVDVTRAQISEKDSARIPALLHTVNDIERIGDHAVNLLKLNDKKTKRKPFTKKAADEIKHMKEIVDQMIIDTEKAMSSNRNAAKRVCRNEKLLNKLTSEYKNNHIKRLERKQCDINVGVLFVDYLKNLEKIGDHLTNIAEAKLDVLKD